MIITCDECNSSFSVGDNLIKESGSKVRCSKCDAVFVAYPQTAEEIEPAEEELGLDDLDSDLDDFLGEDGEDETPAMSNDADESELDLSDFDDTLGLTTDLESDSVLEDTEGELELDLDFEQDDDSELMINDESIAGDDLPELEDLDSLDETELIADENDSDIENLDFDLEPEPEAEGELKLEGEDDLDLADLALDEEDNSMLADQSAEEIGELEVDESDELDLTDLEQSLDDDISPEEAADIGLDELDFDLEENGEEVAEAAEAELKIETDDELELSDLDLEMEEASETEEKAEAVAEELELDLDSDLAGETVAASEKTDADELDLGLDLEDETVAASEETDADELDLSDLSSIMEDEETPAAEPQPEELDLALELESDGAIEGDEPAEVADSGEIDELDLSDLEGIMGAEEASPAADDSAQDLELDLDLQMDEETPATEAADASQDDQLDFSDLEQMLESDETPSVETPEGNVSEELELDFDLDEPDGGSADVVAAGETGAEAKDDDFLDIEELLEEGEESSPLESVDLNGDVTDLPLEMEEALDDASKGAEAELELDFDLESELQAKEDLFEADESEDQLESNLLASDEVDFLEEAGVEETEFQVEETEFQDDGETSVIGTDDFASNELTETDSTNGETQVLPGAESELATMEIEDEVPVEHAPQSSRSKKPLIAVVLLILIAVGVLIVPNMLGLKIPYVSDIKIPYISDLDIKIPYLSDWLNPEPQDVAGNLKIIPLGNTINGKFIQNAKSGQIFVIQGHIKNEYDHPRSYIKVTGKLYIKGKKMAKQATVYCGNMLSNSELASMDIATINKKLRTRSGEKGSNLKVTTGKRVPFMIVFDRLPRNLDEYTVEVEGSAI